MTSTSLPTDVTQLLDRWSEGDHEALEELMPYVMEDLRGVAARHLASERAAHTLQPTALVNELYIRLAGRRQVTWQNRSQFFAFAATLMRNILVDHARRRQREKRGGGVIRIAYDEQRHAHPVLKEPILLDLNDALDSLSKLDPRQGRIVEMYIFTGLKITEIAEVEGISPTTVKREWRTAKLWLERELRAKDDEKSKSS